MSATTLDQSPRPVVITWLGTRLLLLLVALAITYDTGADFEAVVGNWDVQRFVAIAEHGYTGSTDVAFFWGLPMLMRGVAALGLPMITGTLVLAQVASALAASALLRIAGAQAACIWLLLPMTVFTAVPYTEPFFCALAFWAWWRALRGHWAQAGVLAALACTFRVSGLFLLVALFVLALTQHGRAPRQRLADSRWLLLPVAALGAYLVFLYFETGSWTAWYTAQGAGWQRNLSWPWDALQATLPMTAESYWPGRPEVAVMFRFEIVAVVLGYLTVIWCLVKRRWAQAVWVAASVVALSSSGWFISVTRAVLLWFPLCALVAAIAGWRPGSRGALLAWRLLLGLVLVADLVLMAWWAWCFGTGRWAS